MASAATISCATASGKSLDELSRLVALRAERLGELTKDSVIATAIDVLVSLRADTRDARDGDKADPPKRITPRRDLFVSFNNTLPYPILRTSGPHGPQLGGVHKFYTADQNVPVSELTVFEIVPAHESAPKYFVAATSATSALKFEGERIRRRIRQYGGLAKTALGVAMAKLSTRNVDDGVGSRARLVASKLSQVEIHYSGGAGASGEFGLSYTDHLNYAVPALKSGESGVELALQKAANKIAGMITHAAHKAGDFEHDIPSPFPDIKRRR